MVHTTTNGIDFEMLCFLFEYIKSNLIGEQAKVVAKSASISLIKPPINPKSGEWVFAIEMKLDYLSILPTNLNARGMLDAIVRMVHGR